MKAINKKFKFIILGTLLSAVSLVSFVACSKKNNDSTKPTDNNENTNSSSNSTKPSVENNDKNNSDTNVSNANSSNENNLEEVNVPSISALELISKLEKLLPREHKYASRITEYRSKAFGVLDKNKNFDNLVKYLPSEDAKFKEKFDTKGFKIWLESERMDSKTELRVKINLIDPKNDSNNANTTIILTGFESDKTEVTTQISENINRLIRMHSYWIQNNRSPISKEAFPVSRTYESRPKSQTVKDLRAMTSISSLFPVVEKGALQLQFLRAMIEDMRSVPDYRVQTEVLDNYKGDNSKIEVYITFISLNDDKDKATVRLIFTNFKNLS
ncbi:hypothetical protein [Mycoplasmopsis alligatoris]|uniref:Lipoprotein n=1 Tax=Mycoplasmopsis alligatoris A21JP2 TaxID=747682 RepID=D4XVR1_9BACT|nr:hypothetical protein [Mycoplasmopsis alligatoris]EFF41567.1 hypothetical protein MALL_0089 [Mycoplasmopsis alligatoris A21JP2]